MAQNSRQKERAAPLPDYGAFAGQADVGQMLGNRNGASLDQIHDLQSRQCQKGFVSTSDVSQVAQAGRVSPAQARGIATFYSMLDVVDASDATDAADSTPRRVIRVCDGPSCCLRGAFELKKGLSELVAHCDDVCVTRTSCIGKCDVAPAFVLDNQAFGQEEGTKVVSAGDLATLAGVVPEATVSVLESRQDEKCGTDLVDTPLTSRFQSRAGPSVGDASFADSSRFSRALKMSPEELIELIEHSELRGRGGAGFNTGSKWRIVANSPFGPRYVVCNADESEPGTFKDRALMECDPQLLLEGMAVCGYAVGAKQGIIYIRGEYAHAAGVLEKAITAARKSRVLSSADRKSGFAFDIVVHRGAGAYVCGEETALLESLEGKRGEPRNRPPYPTTSGYLGCSTVVNNVETLCSVPFIVEHGAEAYRRLGRGGASGSKLFCLSGHVDRPGVCEAPLGITTRELLEDYAGGMRGGAQFKLAVTGGAAGTLIPAAMLDIPLSFESWKSGVAVGSGGIIIADNSVSAVTMLLWLMQFFEFESCGKCTPCRVGTRQVRKMVQRIADSQGQPGDIERLLQLAKTLERTSFCGLGQSVAWPIKSAIEHFRADFAQLGAT